jgi:hypothetical protein
VVAGLDRSSAGEGLDGEVDRLMREITGTQVASTQVASTQEVQ